MSVVDGPDVYRPEEMVIGEGVAVELPVASLGQRILARLIDLAVTAIAAVAVYVAIFRFGRGGSGATLQTLILLGNALIVLLAPAILEVLTRGRSVGKIALGLRVVRDDAGPITARQAFVRALIGLIEIYAMVGGPALICGLLSRKTKRLGDFAAGTYAISERHDISLAFPLPVHPSLAAWTAHADLGPIPTSLAVASRQFLARNTILTPQARDEIGRDLWRQMSGYIYPPAPQGWHHEHLLYAVLAERRIRDSARLAREAELRRRVLG